MSGFVYFDLSEWQSEQSHPGCLCSGLYSERATMGGSALWVLGSLGRNRLALRLGGIAITSSGVVLATAAAAGVLS